jgi:hypothetical protein
VVGTRPAGIAGALSGTRIRRTSSAAPRLAAGDIAVTTLPRPVRAASPSGVGPATAIATAIAAASLGVKFSGGRVIAVSSE